MTSSNAPLQKIAASLAALAEAELRDTQDEYDHARYVRMTRLAAELDHIARDDAAAAVERGASGMLVAHTPIVGVDAAIFDAEGRILLIQRADNRKWAMPGGAADVGESPAEGAAREAWEETGLRVQPTRLLGVYDSRKSGSYRLHRFYRAAFLLNRLLKRVIRYRGPNPRQLYHFTFECVIVDGALTTTNETVGYGYFAADRLPPLFRSHNFRVPDAFRQHRSGGPATFQ